MARRVERRPRARGNAATVGVITSGGVGTAAPLSRRSRSRWSWRCVRRGHRLACLGPRTRRRSPHRRDGGRSRDLRRRWWRARWRRGRGINGAPALSRPGREVAVGQTPTRLTAAVAERPFAGRAVPTAADAVRSAADDALTGRTVTRLRAVVIGHALVVGHGGLGRWLSGPMTARCQAEERHGEHESDHPQSVTRGVLDAQHSRK